MRSSWSGAVQLVDVADAAHAELGALALRQVAQRGVEAARPEEEAGVQHLAVAQLAPQALRGHARAAGRGSARSASIHSPPRDAHPPGLELDLLAEYPVARSASELRLVELRPHAGRERAEDARAEALGLARRPSSRSSARQS